MCAYIVSKQPAVMAFAMERVKNTATGCESTYESTEYMFQFNTVQEVMMWLR